jgi:hypothetical protein
VMSCKPLIRQSIPFMVSTGSEIERYCSPIFAVDVGSAA